MRERYSLTGIRHVQTVYYTATPIKVAMYCWILQVVYCAVVNKYYLKLCFRKYIRLGVMNYDNKIIF